MTTEYLETLIARRPEASAPRRRPSTALILGVFAAVCALSAATSAPAQGASKADLKEQVLGPYSRKVSGALLPALEQVRTRALAPDDALAALLADEDARAISYTPGTVVLDLDIEVNDRSKAYVTGTGATIFHESVEYNNLVVEATIAQAEALAKLPEVNYAKAAMRPMSRSELNSMPGNGGERTGSVTSEADIHMRVADARMSYGVSGMGQTIGTISDSINDTAGVGGVRGGAVPNATLTGSIPQGTSDLPANIQVVDFGGGGGTDEGAGMMELIHDLAPMVAQAFGSSGANQSVMAANILSLANNAFSTVIVDDIFFFNEPTFQDGPIAQSITTVTGMDIPYFTAAGNDGTDGVMANYTDVNAATNDNSFPPSTGADFHNWGIGTATPSFLPFTMGPGSGGNPHRGRFLLYWNQPYATLGLGAGSEVDLDIYVYGAANTANPAITSSADTQGSTGMPSGDSVEIVTVVNNSQVNNASAFLAINHFGGTKANVLMRVVWVGGTITFPSGGFTGPTIIGHAMTNDGVSVAAMDFLAVQNAGMAGNIDGFESIAAPPEGFTGLGGLGANGLPIFFNTTGGAVMPSPQRRNVPSLTGIDGTNTSTFGRDRGGDADAFPNFFGTSAAAPHVAAVAALMLERSQNLLTPKQIETIMRKTAFDITGAPAAFGEDNRTGAGLVNALHAVWLAGADDKDDENTAEDDFVKIVFEVPEPIDIDDIEVLITYGDSNPTDAGVNFGGANPPVIVGDPQAVAGNLRLWKKNGNEVRNPKNVNEGGDYISFGLYTPAELGLSAGNRTIDLWIEGVRTDKPAGTDEILFDVVKAGTLDTLCKDVVRVTVQDI